MDDAEARAAYQALKCVEALKKKHVIFEDDALNVILALNGSDDHLDWRDKSHILKDREMLANHCI